MGIGQYSCPKPIRGRRDVEDRRRNVVCFGESELMENVPVCLVREEKHGPDREVYLSPHGAVGGLVDKVKDGARPR